MFLTQHVNFPTHNSGTMPGLVFSSEENLILSAESAGTLGSSDHDMIIVNTQLHCKKNESVQESRNWRKADVKAIVNDFNTIDWDTILLNKGTQQSWDCLKKVLDKVVDDHVPIRSVKNGGKPI